MVFLVLVGAAALADLSRPPERQFSARVLLGGVHLYQHHLRSLTGGGGRCRFTPTCSRYAEQCIGDHGAVKGAALTVWRLARCGPWTPAGTEDPPPPRTPSVDDTAAGP
jgi:putative membrane protein insertion efficiency factor